MAALVSVGLELVKRGSTPSFANEAELADFVRSVAAGRDVAETVRGQVAADAGKRFVVVFNGSAGDVTPAVTRTFFGNEEIDDRLHLWRDLWAR